MVIAERNHNGLATEQRLVVLVALVTDFLRAARKAVLDADAHDLWRGTIGSVPGRELSEDEYVEVDKSCEDLLVLFVREVYQEHGISFWIRSEHHPVGYGIGCERQEEASVECDIDPFDGTDQYRKRLRSAWWSVLTFSQGGKPLVGGAVDMLGGAIYRGYSGKIEEIITRTNHRAEKLPRTETYLSDESVVTSYKGKWRYFFPWVRRVTRLFSRKSLAGITHYGDGGSFVYALLAAGVLTAYIMDRVPGEPISEISPGAGFVESAGLCLLVVKGRNIKRFNPLSGMEGRVDGIFIAACNEELAWSIAKQLQSSFWGQIVQMFEKIKSFWGFRRLSMQST